MLSGKIAKTFVVLAYPSSEPQVFTSISAMVTAAYLSSKQITVTYVSAKGQTDRATGVEF